MNYNTHGMLYEYPSPVMRARLVCAEIRKRGIMCKQMCDTCLFDWGEWNVEREAQFLEWENTDE